MIFNCFWTASFAKSFIISVPTSATAAGKTRFYEGKNNTLSKIVKFSFCVSRAFLGKNNFS